MHENRNHSGAGLQCPAVSSRESLWGCSQFEQTPTSGKDVWAVPPSIVGISGGRALSRGFESRSTEPPVRASRRIRVTVPTAASMAAALPKAERRLCGHALGSHLAQNASALCWTTRPSQVVVRPMWDAIRATRAITRRLDPLMSCEWLSPAVRLPLLWPRWRVLSPHSFVRRCGRRRFGGNPRVPRGSSTSFRPCGCHQLQPATICTSPAGNR